MSDEKKSFDEEYRLGLQYKKGDGVEKNLDQAIAHLKKASESQKQWIVNDYALALIERGSPSDLDEAISVLANLCVMKNHQSIRLMGLANIKKHPDCTSIGECLLNYSADLGNEWALFDLFSIKYKRNTFQDRQYISSCYNSEYANKDAIAAYIFKVIIGLKGGLPDIEKVEYMFKKSIDNKKLHLEYLRLIAQTKNSIFADLIINDDMYSSPEYMFEIAKMYRDGVVLKKSNAMFNKICRTLPEELKNMLETD